MLFSSDPSAMITKLTNFLGMLSRRKYAQPPVPAATIKRVLIICALSYIAILVFSVHIGNLALWFLAVIPLGPCLGLYTSISVTGVAADTGKRPGDGPKYSIGNE